MSGTIFYWKAAPPFHNCIKLSLGYVSFRTAYCDECHSVDPRFSIRMHRQTVGLPDDNSDMCLECATKHLSERDLQLLKILELPYLKTDLKFHRCDRGSEWYKELKQAIQTIELRNKALKELKNDPVVVKAFATFQWKMTP